jgi:membrane protein DedA with SNARE-associated domain
MEFRDIINWLMNISVSYGYTGVFLISLIGGLSIFFPVPDSVVVFTIAGLKAGGAWVFDVPWIVVAAGFGSAVGEFSGYLLGLSGRKALTKRYKKRMDFLEKVFNRFGSIAIFLFALTPLPDDLIFIPLGAMRYNIIKAFIPALLGKLSLNLIVAYGGRFLVQAVGNIFGVGSDWLSALVSMSLGIIAFIALFKVDWEKYLEKYLTNKDNSGKTGKQA